MYFRVLVVISLLKLSECQYGTAELIKFSQPRRSRLLSDFIDSQESSAVRQTTPSQDQPITAESAPRSLPMTEKLVEQRLDGTATTFAGNNFDNDPVPTADTIRKYARIFKLDTENLNENQRMLLTKLVQRIARLNGAQSGEQSIDLNGNEGRARHRNRDERKKSSSKKPSSTAAQQTDTSHMDSVSSSEPLRSTTTATKSKTSAQKKKVAASNVQNHISIETTPPIGSTVTEPTIPIASKAGKSKVTQANDATLSNANSVDLGNISTTSIVNILSTDNARENLYVRRPSPATIAAVHDKLPSHHKVSAIQYFLFFTL